MSIAEKLIKRFSNEDAFKLSDKKQFIESEWTSTGIPILDYNIGGFGYNKGYIEISGASKGGKSTIALTGMREHQKRNPNGLRVILSTEEREHKLYSEQIGVDTNDVIILRSRFVEDLFFKFQQLIDELELLWKEEKLPGKPKVYAMLDSIGALNSRADLATFNENVSLHKKASEKGTKLELKNAKIGDFAKTFKTCMKAILSQLYEKDIVFVALNHYYESIGGMGQPTKVSTGGKSVEYLPNLRLRVDRIGDEKLEINGQQEVIAQKSKITIIKNDWGGRRATEINILLGYGITLSQEDIDYAVEKGIVKKHTEKKYSFMNEKMSWSSPRTFYQLYKDNNKLLQVLNTKLVQERHKDTIKEKNLQEENK